MLIIVKFCMCDYVLVFFKQKTAYEMRISDWSSDVCSSDLGQQDAAPHHRIGHRIAAFRRARRHALHGRLAQDVAREDGSRLNIALLEPDMQLGARERCIGADRQRKGDRKRVVGGNRGTVRVDLGCRLYNKKKKKEIQK